MKHFCAFFVSFCLCVLIAIPSFAERPVSVEEIEEAELVCFSDREEFYFRGLEGGQPRVWFRRPSLDDSGSTRRLGRVLTHTRLEQSEEEREYVVSLLDSWNNLKEIRRGTAEFSKVVREAFLGWDDEEISPSLWENTDICDSAGPFCSQYQLGDVEKVPAVWEWTLQLPKSDGTSYEAEFVIRGQRAQVLRSSDLKKVFDLRCRPLATDEVPTLFKDEVLEFLQVLNNLS